MNGKVLKRKKLVPPLAISQTPPTPQQENLHIRSATLSSAVLHKEDVGEETKVLQLQEYLTIKTGQAGSSAGSRKQKERVARNPQGRGSAHLTWEENGDGHILQLL